MAIHTALARFAGRPVGIVANNPKHLGGAIDADAALKAARFYELCDAFDLPILNLVDCPGNDASGCVCMEPEWQCIVLQ